MDGVFRSRNLCKDQCCGQRLRLADLVGKPLEFRKYYDYAPRPGVKWTCPICNRTYFVWIRTGHTHWGDGLKHQFEEEYINYGFGHRHKNTSRGKHAKRTINPITGEESIEELGWYEFDMSFYESFNDEGEGKDTDDPAHLCTEDDERTRRYL
jgi:hypothetical protein